MRKSSAAFSIVDSAGGYTGTQEAGCRATLAIVVVPQCVLIVVVVLILSSSLTMQLAFRQQRACIWTNCLSSKSCCSSRYRGRRPRRVQTTSLFVFTLTTVVKYPGGHGPCTRTTDADVGGCPRRVFQTRAVVIVKTGRRQWSADLSTSV